MYKLFKKSISKSFLHFVISTYKTLVILFNTKQTEVNKTRNTEILLQMRFLMQYIRLQVFVSIHFADISYLMILKTNSLISNVAREIVLMILVIGWCCGRSQFVIFRIQMFLIFLCKVDRLFLVWNILSFLVFFLYCFRNSF